MLVADLPLMSKLGLCGMVPRWTSSSVRRPDLSANVSSALVRSFASSESSAMATVQDLARLLAKWSGRLPVDIPRGGFDLSGELGADPSVLEIVEFGTPAGKSWGEFGMTVFNFGEALVSGKGFRWFSPNDPFWGETMFSLLGGRGESGTFHIIASSGRSSSKSSYSFSSSFAVFRVGCHEPLLTGAVFKGGDDMAGHSETRLIVADLGSIGMT